MGGREREGKGKEEVEDDNQTEPLVREGMLACKQPEYELTNQLTCQTKPLDSTYILRQSHSGSSLNHHNSTKLDSS